MGYTSKTHCSNSKEIFKKGITHEDQGNRKRMTATRFRSWKAEG